MKWCVEPFVSTKLIRHAIETWKNNYHVIESQLSVEYFQFWDSRVFHFFLWNVHRRLFEFIMEILLTSIRNTCRFMSKDEECDSVFECETKFSMPYFRFEFFRLIELRISPWVFLFMAREFLQFLDLCFIETCRLPWNFSRFNVNLFETLEKYREICVKQWTITLLCFSLSFLFHPWRYNQLWFTIVGRRPISINLPYACVFIKYEGGDHSDVKHSLHVR